MDVNAYVESIDDDWNIEVEISESKDKKLIRFKDVAAYNVAQYLIYHSCHSVEGRQVPISLKKIIQPFVINELL